MNKGMKKIMTNHSLCSVRCWQRGIVLFFVLHISLLTPFFSLLEIISHSTLHTPHSSIIHAGNLLTDRYNLTSDIKIELNRDVKLKDRYVYIAMAVNNGGPEWRVLDFGKVKNCRTLMSALFAMPILRRILR